MKTIFFLLGFVSATLSFSQIAGTSFEEPAHFSGKYTDTGDPALAHDLINNPDEPLVNSPAIGNELGFNARYEPYDEPDVGSTDGDYVGVTRTKPHSSVPYTHGAKGYRMQDVDGNYILEFDPVDLSEFPSATVSVDFLLSINSDPTKGNYEGDGTLNMPGHDRLRIFVKNLNSGEEIFLFDSTGTNLDEFVPFDSGEGKYLLQWQTVSADLPANPVQLVIEGRNNAKAESFWFDNIVFQEKLNLEKTDKKHFTVFPNPAAEGKIQILSESSDPKHIVIFDVLGRQVLETEIKSEIADVSSLKSGIYMLKIRQNQFTAIHKLIIK